MGAIPDPLNLLFSDFDMYEVTWILEDLINVRPLGAGMGAEPEGLAIPNQLPVLNENEFQ